MRALLVGIVLVAGAGAALGHDIYNGVREGMSGAGRLCCGGDPVTGDCEAVGAEYTVLANGDAYILTRRYGGKWVHIAKDRIQWFAVPGGEHSEVHWCGKPRPAGVSPTPDDPDPDYMTYCIFIRPGGV